jgi:hypothetical protein
MHPQVPPPQRPPSVRPSAPPPEDRASWVTRFGSLSAAGAFAAALSTIPAALRIGSTVANVDTIGAWLGLVGLAVIPCTFGACIFRGAYTGLRAFAGEGASARAAGIALWIALLIVSLTAYGSLLRATTHHHGLAGTTFAIGAVVLALAGGAVAGRIGAFVQKTTEDAQRIFAGASFIVLLGSIAVVASRLGHGEASPVVDALALLLAMVFVGQPIFSGRKALAIVGPPIAATFLFLGIATVRSSPVLQDALAQGAPVFGSLVKLAVARR